MVLYNDLDETKKIALSNDLDDKLSVQKAKLNLLLDCIEKTNQTIQLFDINLIDEQSLQIFNKNFKLLLELQMNLDYLSYNISNLTYLKQLLVNIPVNYANENQIKTYNKLADKCEKALYLTNICVDNIISEYKEAPQLDIDIHAAQATVPLATDVSSQNNKTHDESISQTPNTITNNNVLLISEIQNKVFLPYSIKELNEIFKQNKKYNSLKEVIEDKYILPLDKYKNPFISRFKEAYSLMRIRENASIIDSINLALDVTFNSLLNPAIITACKNLDELDIYLDCLSSNELDKFDIFEIKYEIRPSKHIKPKGV